MNQKLVKRNVSFDLFQINYFQKLTINSINSVLQSFNITKKSFLFSK